MQPGRTHAQDCSFPETTSAALHASKNLLKWHWGKVQDKVSGWAIWPHTELQGLQMGKKAAICLVTCWGLLGISCSSNSWEEAAHKMPVCDNFKIQVLQCPDSHSWSNGAGQGTAQNILALKPLTCWADILCSHADVKWNVDVFLDIWVYCSGFFHAILGICKH